MAWQTDGEPNTVGKKRRSSQCLKTEEKKVTKVEKVEFGRVEKT